jgi:hypothetical protein
MTLNNRATAAATLMGPLLLAASVCQADGTGFRNVCSWQVYDPGDHGVGNDPDGYHDAVFDGRYLYFVPYKNEGSSFSGEVLRFDTAGAFSDTASWTTYDPGAHGVGSHPDGYTSAISDGRYVYFVPWADVSGYHGEVLRYDTLAEFADTSSWIAYDPGAHGVGNDPDGYRGGAFDGRYIYFAPTYNGTRFHGEVLRLDTTGDFTDVSSWATYDAGDHGVGTDPDGYSYASFDGRYVYFSPYHNGTAYHGEVLRYDVAGGFSDAASWSTYDPGQHGVGDDPDGYPGTVFDGRYVYFVPYNNGTSYHGEVLRYDTSGDFLDVSAWATFDAKDHGVGDDPTGYCGAVFDDRYVYFVPAYNAGGDHAEVLRYDTLGEFAEASSWFAFDPKDHEVGGENRGYRGGTFDGRFVYFAPAGYPVPHGEVLRYDTAAPASDLNCDGCVDQADLGILLADWGCASDCAGDLDGDDDTDQADLGILLAHWGEGCP